MSIFEHFSEHGFEKHDKDDGDRAGLVFKSIPEQLSNHNSVFKLSVVDESAGTRNCANAVELFRTVDDYK